MWLPEANGHFEAAALIWINGVFRGPRQFVALESPCI
jgi:hypothetical protein